jgi:hypothetical protein
VKEQRAVLIKNPGTRKRAGIVKTPERIKRMLAKTPLREQMLAWLAEQKPHTFYDYGDPEVCACGQFAKHIGSFDEWIAGLRSIPFGNDWQMLNKAASACSTLGELRYRLLSMEE